MREIALFYIFYGMKQAHIYELIKHFFKGSLSKKDQDVVQLWLTMGDHGKEKDDALRMMWQQCDDAMSQQNTDAAWTSLDSRIESYERHVNRMKTVKRLLRYAAIFILPAVLAATSWIGSSYYYCSSANMIECAVPDGTTYTLYLSDKTKVRLNGGSRIIYPERFGLWSKRNVFLEGEAHFEVTPDKRRPFIVNIDNVDVCVLGTHFNVRAYRDEDNIITTLEEGSVRVSDGHEEILLKPNEQVVYSRGRKMFDEVAMTVMTEKWISGDLKFENQSLQYILSTIGNRYGVTFDVEAGVNLNKQYTVKFRANEHLEDVLDVLSILENKQLRFDMNKNKVLIHKQRKEAAGR